jgi:hypothetical protein
MSGAGAVRAVGPGVWTCGLCASDLERHLRPYRLTWRQCDRCKGPRDCWDASARLVVCVACTQPEENWDFKNDPRTRVEHGAQCERCKQTKTCMHVPLDAVADAAWRKAVAYEALTGLPYHCRRVRAWHPEHFEGRNMAWRLIGLGHLHHVDDIDLRQWRVTYLRPARYDVPARNLSNKWSVTP